MVLGQKHIIKKNKGHYKQKKRKTDETDTTMNI